MCPMHWVGDIHIELLLSLLKSFYYTQTPRTTEHFMKTSHVKQGFLGGKELACRCRRRGFDSWVGKIPGRRKWQPTPVFLPILAWKIPWTEEPGRLQFMGSQRTGHDWAHMRAHMKSRSQNKINRIKRKQGEEENKNPKLSSVSLES